MLIHLILLVKEMPFKIIKLEVSQLDIIILIKLLEQNMNFL